MASPLDVLHAVAERVFARCQVPGCSLFTLGVVCGTCSRRVCLRHAFVGLATAPPTTTCAPCILMDNPELLKKATYNRSGEVVLEPEVIIDDEVIT